LRGSPWLCLLCAHGVNEWLRVRKCNLRRNPSGGIRNAECGEHQRVPFGDRLGAQRADGLTAGALAGHKTGAAESAEVPTDQRLREAGRLDQLGDGGWTLGESADKIQPIGVSKGAVDTTRRLNNVALASELVRGGMERRNALGGHREAS